MTVSSADLMIALHSEHARALWGYALRLTGGDRSHAQDVVQETLLRAWRTPRVLEGPATSTRAWLFTVARHLVIDEWRSSRSRREIAVAEPPEPRAEAGGSAATDDLLESWLVADALERLSIEHRQVIVLCHFQGRSVADAARILGVPEGTVKSRTYYALRSLRLVLQEMGVTR
ncbi:sigma-70 family RNA polymerase sigma factor [Cellulomonas sp. KRMCY2]|uniref:sigma-70 family RNA polymerase sigma factor n=1 Tax=Cellulomonas sp. KRMCY2 TaxID=1304865 RepID=UPI00045E6C9E|nr:sigma-70 family RNA polymerase sigma factor [Cellulomonas sp. KRMCY2]